jgi:hypothetical protein
VRSSPKPAVKAASTSNSPLSRVSSLAGASKPKVLPDYIYLSDSD